MPTTVEEIQEIVRIANETKIPLQGIWPASMRNGDGR